MCPSCRMNDAQILPPGHRPGHHLDPRHPVRRARRGPLASHAVPLRQIYPPMAGWSMTPAEIWQAALACCRAVLKGVTAGEVAGIGITNQRETSLIWDRKTRRAAAQRHCLAGPARRGALRRAEEARGWKPKIARKTGLLLDPYFSATKLEWLLKNVKGLQRAQSIAFGTIDSWLIWNLTRRQGACHRCHQCLAHHAVEFEDPRLGRRAAQAVRRAARDPAGGAREPRRFRRQPIPCCWARPFPSWAWRATSRPPASARPVLRRAM